MNNYDINFKNKCANKEINAREAFTLLPSNQVMVFKLRLSNYLSFWKNGGDICIHLDLNVEPLQCGDMGTVQVEFE